MQQHRSLYTLQSHWSFPMANPLAFSNIMRQGFWHLTKSGCFEIIIYELFLSFWCSLNYCFFSDVQNLSFVSFWCCLNYCFFSDVQSLSFVSVWCCLNYYLFSYIQVTQTDRVFNSLQLKHDYTSIIHHLFSEIMSKDKWCELCRFSHELYIHV